MKKRFDTFCVLIDMSRNAVMRPEALKKLLPILKRMGYNSVMLYTEDTYEIEKEPYFGYMRGKYSKAEMKDLDSYAAGIGMEIIPCIQTLAHLDAFVRWGKVPVDYGNILLADDEKTYELIDRMFRSLSECFRSRKIHVGMDEAAMIGRGKHMDLHGYEDANIVIRRHLERVAQIARKYGYEAMIWSDMFFRNWGSGGYGKPKCKIPDEIAKSFPKDVIPVYWNYYDTEETIYDNMLDNHKQLSDRVWFAGGAWGWSGFAPFNRFTVSSMRPAMNACEKNRVRNIIMAKWGDDGAECPVLSVLPSLYYVSCYARGERDEEKIKAGFRRIVGMNYDDFMKLDLPNELTDPGNNVRNPSKYMLYSDCFNDYLDYTVQPGGGERYAEFAKELSAISKKSRKFGFLFDTEAKLCSLLEVKYELGIHTRRAYEAGDKKELLRLAQEDYSEAIRRFRIFGKAFEKQWDLLNKPNGFDVHHQRIGGTIYRLMACRQRIMDYAAGKIERIDELEEPLLPFGEKETAGYYNRGCYYMTPNIVYHDMLNG